MFIKKYLSINLASCLIGIAFLAVSLYMEYVVGLIPCPLCQVQRILLTIGVVLILFALVVPHFMARLILQDLIMDVSAVGLVFAGRQVWLQSQPQETSLVCSPNSFLSYFNHLPWNEGLQQLFKGTSSCAEVQSTFLGLSLAWWSVGIFVLLCCFALYSILLLMKLKQGHGPAPKMGTRR